MSETEEPLNTSMSAHYGKPGAVSKLLRSLDQLVLMQSEDMRLSIEIEVWEHGAREGDEERFTESNQE